jgi:hypothetical protein
MIFTVLLLRKIWHIHDHISRCKAVAVSELTNPSSSPFYDASYVKICVDDSRDLWGKMGVIVANIADVDNVEHDPSVFDVFLSGHSSGQPISA